MSTSLQNSASRKASTTTSTSNTSAILPAGAKATATTHPNGNSTGNGAAVTPNPNGAVKKPIVNVGTHSHESVTRSSSVSESISTHHHHHESTTDLSVKTGHEGHGHTHQNGHEKAKPIGYDLHGKTLTTRDSDVYEKFKKVSTRETSICITEEQKQILHKGTRSLGDALGQVPWMKFRLVAEPNMDCFSSDERLKTFIRQVTELTVSIVNKQCTDEIAVLTGVLVAHLHATMQARTKLIEETIIEQIASLCLEDSMTACLNLDKIKEKVCFPQHHDHSKYGTHGASDKHHHDDHDHHHHGHAHVDTIHAHDSHNHKHND